MAGKSKATDSFHRCAHPILQKPHLRDLIKLDPTTRVNPDKDVPLTGQSEIYYASYMSAVRSPEGAFTGSMRTKIIETLLQAYRTTTSSELGDSPQAIAELVARYKDGPKSGAHNVAHKSCYTAPPSLSVSSSLRLELSEQLRLEKSHVVLHL